MADIPGDLSSDAILDLGVPFVDAIETVGDTGWIGLDVEAGKSYIVELSLTSDPYLASARTVLRDSAGQEIVRYLDVNGHGFFFAAEADGRVFVEVGGLADAIGSYEILATEVPDMSPEAVSLLVTGDMHAAYQNAAFSPPEPTEGKLGERNAQLLRAADLSGTISATKDVSVNDSQAVLSAGTTITGVFEGSGSTDTYQFNVSAGQEYLVTLDTPESSGSFDPKSAAISIYRGDVLIASWDTGYYAAALSLSPMVTEELSIVVTPRGTGTFTLGAAEVSDAIAGSRLTTGSLAPGEVLTGTIDYVGDRDWFSFDAQAGVKYQIAVEGLQYLTVRPLDEDGVFIDSFAHVVTAGSFSGEAVFYTHQDRTVFLEVTQSPFEVPIGGYTLSATVSRDAVADDSFTDAVLVAGGSVTGMTDHKLDYDFYRFETITGGRYLFTAESVEGFFQPKIYLYDSAGERLGLAASLTTSPQELMFEATAGGEIFVNVYADSGEDYTLSALDLSLDVPGDATTTEVLTPGVGVTGELEFGTDADWYRLTTEASTGYALLLDAFGQPDNLTDAVFSVATAGGTVLASAPVSELLATPLRIEPGAGEIFVQITGTGTAGSFFLFAEEDAEGDTRDTASAIAVGDNIDATIATELDVDFFQFSAEAGSAYVIDVDVASFEQIDLFASLADGTLLGQGSGLTLISDIDQDIYLRTSGFTIPGESIDYTISVRAGLPLPYEDPTAPLLTGLDSGFAVAGSGSAGGKLRINYYFGRSLDEFFDDGIESYRADKTWNTYERARIEAALALFEQVLNVDFVATSNRSSADIAFYAARIGGVFSNDIFLNEGELGITVLPSGPFGGNIILNYQGLGWDTSASAGSIFDGGLEQFGLGFSTIIHEVGHALGLDHPFESIPFSTLFPGLVDSNGDGIADDPFFDTGSFGLNQSVFTIMSYVTGWTEHPFGTADIFLGDAIFAGSGAPGGNPGSLMALDIAALQQKYGLNQTFADGDDVYLLQDAQTQATGYSAIWDTGGTDAIRYSGQRDTTIDLRAATLAVEEGGGGFVSFVDGGDPADPVVGGFTIAHLVEIENASTGGGNDVLRGNAVSNHLEAGDGDDTLTGGAGDDTLDGGTGTDIAVFAGFAADYQASDVTAASLILTDLTGNEGADLLLGIETLRFADRDISTASLQAPPPEIAPLTFSAIENALPGTVIGTVTATDPSGLPLTFSLSGSSLFAVDPDTGTVTVAGPLDFETAPSLALTITASNGLTSSDALLTVDIEDVSEGTPGDDVQVSDTIIWFEGSPGADTITGGASVENWLDYSQSDAGVSVDLDGDVSGSFAEGDVLTSIEHVIGSDHDDILSGDVGANSLLGGLGNDRLSGDGGLDVLFGGEGNDTLTGIGDGDTLDGGTGDDRYLISAPGDVIVEAADGGTDLMSGSVDFVLPENVERGSTLGSGDVAITGNGLDNFITGNAGSNVLSGLAGHDRLIAGDGDDTLIGGTGNDILEGGTGSNRFVFAPGDGHDQVRGFQPGLDLLDFSALGLSFADLHILDSGGSTMITFESAGQAGSVVLIGTAPEDLTQHFFTGLAHTGQETWGSSGSDNLATTPGAEEIFGLAGNDTLFGRGGGDQMYGGFGDDRYLLLDPDDEAWEEQFQGTDQINAAFSFTLPENIENGATLGNGQIDITGNALGNYLSGNAAANTLIGGGGRDRLQGFDGDDVLIGGADNDVLDGGTGADIFVLDFGAQLDLILDFEIGVDLIDLTATGLSFGQLTIADTPLGALIVYGRTPGAIDQVTLRGVLAEELRLDSILTVFGADQPPISGTDGPESILGTVEDDEIHGLGGNDYIDGRGGADLMLGGPGDDRFIFDDPGDSAVEAPGEGHDRVYTSVSTTLGDNIEDATATGTSALDITGNDVANWIVGNAGANTLAGGAGNDRLQGREGEDVLIGGTGSDILEGGADADTFVFAPGDGADQIIGFEAGLDRIDFSATTLTETDVTITQTGGHTAITYGPLADTITLLNTDATTIDEDTFLFA